jgi:hypothetical protein
LAANCFAGRSLNSPLEPKPGSRYDDWRGSGSGNTNYRLSGARPETGRPGKNVPRMAGSWRKTTRSSFARGNRKSANSFILRNPSAQRLRLTSSQIRVKLRSVERLRANFTASTGTLRARLAVGNGPAFVTVRYPHGSGTDIARRFAEGAAIPR